MEDQEFFEKYNTLIKMTKMWLDSIRPLDIPSMLRRVTKAVADGSEAHPKLYEEAAPLLRSSKKLMNVALEIQNQLTNDR